MTWTHGNRGNRFIGTIGTTEVDDGGHGNHGNRCWVTMVMMEMWGGALVTMARDEG